MEATVDKVRRVRKKRRRVGSARPAPKGRRWAMGAGLLGILIVGLLAVYELVGPESAAALVPGYAASR